MTAPTATTETTSTDTASSASPLDRHAAPVTDQANRSGRAITALVLGIISILGAVLSPLLGVILGIIAIVLGATARSDIRRTGQRGAGQAKAGWILGSVGIVVAVINFIAFVALVANK
ncbi:MAG: hypothetical protein QOE28_396 [Solirubrobacteraceae bacterium]|jgi:hypothetical protein|nr:hypothetical protein [Solirubrobacteraceae bacterium]